MGMGMVKHMLGVGSLSTLGLHHQYILLAANGLAEAPLAVMQRHVGFVPQRTESCAYRVMELHAKLDRAVQELGAVYDGFGIRDGVRRRRRAQAGGAVGYPPRPARGIRPLVGRTYGTTAPTKASWWADTRGRRPGGSVWSGRLALCNVGWSGQELVVGRRKPRCDPLGASSRSPELFGRVVLSERLYDIET